MSARYLSDNLFDPTIYQDHVLSAEEEASGNEVERISDGRRSARDRWEPTTANSSTYVEVACDVTRSADLLVIDREHNLSGVGIELLGSDDDFGTAGTSVFDVTVPSTVTEPDALSGGPVRTLEGAVLISFTSASYESWRLVIDAMGAGLVPKISGLWLGTSFVPSTGPLLAGYDDEAGDLSIPSVVTDSLWAGSGRIARQKTPSLSHRLADETEWNTIRPWVELYHQGHLMWVIQDEARAERSILSRHPGGSYSVPFAGNRVGRELVLSLREYQPRARRPL